MAPNTTSPATPTPSTQPSGSSLLSQLQNAAQSGLTSVTQLATKVDSMLRGVRNNEEFVKLGDKGERVKALQEDLKALGLDIEVNGKFDEKMRLAIIKFQQTNKLTDQNGNKVDLVADGVIGPRTMRAIDVARGRTVISANEFAKVINYRWSAADGEVPGLSRSQAEENRTWNPEAVNSSEWLQLKNAKAVTVEAAGRLPVNDNMRRLAIESAKVSNRSSSLHLCLGYVNDALENAGLAVERKPWAIQSPSALRASGKFVEVTGMTADKIDSLPPGAIVVYEKPGQGYDYPGHIQVKGMNGKWHSDFTHDSMVYAGTPRMVWAFIPKP